MSTHKEEICIEVPNGFHNLGYGYVATPGWYLDFDDEGSEIAVEVTAEMEELGAGPFILLGVDT